jgi:hypothetical protein
MAKIMLKLFFLQFMFIWLTPVIGQITFEDNYIYSGTYTHLKYSGDKFFLMDVTSNQCKIYNVNHSLWKTINLPVPANHTLYDIEYVSENLFTNDNSLSLAYVYYHYDATNYYYTYYTKIIKENGTELLYIPGCMYLSTHLINQSDTKLLAYVYDFSVSPYTIQTRVYDLPGQLTSFIEEPEGSEWFTATAVPNPSNGLVSISYSFPDEEEKGEIIIMDLRGSIIRTFMVTKSSGQVTVNTSGMPKGNYLFYVRADHYLSKTEKLIVQ